MASSLDDVIDALQQWHAEVAELGELDASLDGLVRRAWRTSPDLACAAAVFAATIRSRGWQGQPLAQGHERDTSVIARFWARWAAALPAKIRGATLDRIAAMTDSDPVGVLEAAALAVDGPSRERIVARLRQVSVTADPEWASSAALAAALLSDDVGALDAAVDQLQPLSGEDVSPLYRGPVNQSAARHILQRLRSWSPSSRRGLGRWLLAYLDGPSELASALLDDYLAGGLDAVDTAAADTLAPFLDIGDTRRLLAAWPDASHRAAAAAVRLAALGHAEEARTCLGDALAGQRSQLVLRRMLPHVDTDVRAAWAQEILAASDVAPTWREVVESLRPEARARLSAALETRGDDEVARRLAAWSSEDFAPRVDQWLTQPRTASAGAWLGLASRAGELSCTARKRLGESCLVAVSELGRPGLWGAEDDHDGLAAVTPLLESLGGTDLLLAATEAIYIAVSRL